MSARDAVIVDAVRTPVGKRNGSLAKVHAVDPSAHVLNALVARNGFDPAVVDDVIWGCVQQVGQQAGNVGRMAVLAAGWPESVPGTTVDRQCGSSQQSIHFAAAGLLSGQYDVAIAGGVEMMSAVPLGAMAMFKDLGRPGGPKVRERYGVTFNQGIGAEMMAEKWGLSRGQLDEFSADSHRKAARAFYKKHIDVGGMPVVAAVRGHALGAGFQLALACDARVVGTDATFGLLEARYGLIPDLGGMWHLAREAGERMHEVALLLGVFQADREVVVRDHRLRLLREGLEQMGGNGRARQPDEHLADPPQPAGKIRGRLRRRPQRLRHHADLSGPP
jgi:hypothetical protein